MSGKILQVFNFLDIRSNDFLKILYNAGVGVNNFIKNMLLLFPKKKSILGETGNFGTNLAPK